MAVLLILLALVVIYVVHYYMQVRKYPKGPTPLPLVGNLLQLPEENLHVYIDELSKKYGPCFTIWMPLPFVVISDYKHLKEAFVTQSETFINRSHLPPETLLQKHLQTGILMSDGDVWRTQRRVSLKILRDFGVGKSLMEEQVKRSIYEMMEQLNSMPKKGVDLFLPIQLCVGNVINESLLGYHFSYKDSSKFERFVKIIDDHLRTSRSFSTMIVQAFPWAKHLPYIGYHGYHKIVANIDLYQKFIEDQVDAQEKTFDPDSAPDNFVHSYIAEMRKGVDGLDMRNLYAVVIDFWLAGMETTSTSLRWHILYMINYPDVQARVREELLRVVGTERMPSMSDKPLMPYTQAVIHEVQRHSNMVPFLLPHTSNEATTVFDHHLPKGTMVFGQIWSILRNDDVFESAETFNPNRFLLEDGKTFNKEVVDRLIPFSIGKRACVGEGLARMELFLIFTALIQKFEFVKTGPTNMSPLWGGVLAPRPYTVDLLPVHSV